MTRNTDQNSLARTVKRLRTIVKVGALLNSSLDLDTVLRVLLQQTLRNLNAANGTIYLLDREKKELQARTMQGRKTIEIRLPVGRGLAGYVARTGKTIRIRDAYKDKRFYPEVDRQSGFKTKTMLCSPMKDGSGRTVGVFQVLNKKKGAFTKEDEEFLKAVSVPATIAIDNARLHLAEVESQRMQRDLEIAAVIQKQLLPRVIPSLEGIQVDALTRPCRAVGGDFYDVLQRGDGTLLLCVADVSGKGVGAALLVSTFQAALHTYIEFGLPLSTIAGRLNRIFFEDSPSESFITCFLCVFDPATGRLQYVNAGHNHPFVVRGDRTPLQLDAGGIGLGMLPAVTYDEGEVVLGKNDVLLLYTDGLTEAMNKEQDLFGEARLWTVLREHSSDDVWSLSDHLVKEVEAFSEGVPQTDDLTLLVAKITKQAQ